MNKVKINLGFLHNLNKKPRKSAGEIKQETLANIANKWKKMLKVDDKENKEHPLFCLHEHCVYWKLKLPSSKQENVNCKECGKKMKRKRKLEEESDDE